MTVLRSCLEAAVAALRWLSHQRFVVTRRTNVYDEIDLDTVDLSRKDNQRVIRNLMRGISRGLRNDESEF